MQQTTTKNPAVKSDYQMNEEIAKKIIAIIESGDIQSWRKTWTTTKGLTSGSIYELVVEGDLPVNLYTMEEYNPLIVKGGFYVTFKQIKAHKLHLNKGAKGTPNYKLCRFIKHLTRNEQATLDMLLESDSKLNEQITDLKNGKITVAHVVFDYFDTTGAKRTFKEDLAYDFKTNQLYYKKFQYVLEYLFNATDCGLTLEEIKKMWKVDEKEPEQKELIRIERVEQVKASYIERAKLTYKEKYQDRAFYQKLLHQVTLPLKNQFKNIEEYYQTMLHEFAHSTGHQSLLNRPSLTTYCGFASETYSKEELVAELSSLYTMISLNLINDDILKNSIAYLKSWSDALKEGIRHNIMSTIAQARKATNLILNYEN